MGKSKGRAMEAKPKRSREEECPPGGSTGSKKPRVAAGEEPMAAEMSDVYRCRVFLEGITQRWR